MLDTSQDTANELAARLRRQGLRAEDMVVLRDTAGLPGAVEAFRAAGTPIIVVTARSLDAEPIELGPIRLDPANNLLRVRGQEYVLRSKPVAVLAALMRNAGRVITREALIHQVWGANRKGHDATLRVYIHQLRQMIEQGGRNRHIVTVRSAGPPAYMFRA